MVVRTVPPRAGQLCAASTPELELTRCPGGVARGISCNVHGWTELRALTGEALIDDQTCTCSRWATALHPLVACLRTCRSMQFLGHLKTSEDICLQTSADICCVCSDYVSKRFIRSRTRPSSALSTGRVQPHPPRPQTPAAGVTKALQSVARDHRTINLWERNQ